MPPNSTLNSGGEGGGGGEGAFKKISCAKSTLIEEDNKKVRNFLVSQVPVAKIAGRVGKPETQIFFALPKPVILS